jgi:hypothetical protein
LAVYKKCPICGGDIEYGEKHPFKICLNCLLIGPDKPGVYALPKGPDLFRSMNDRVKPIVPDKDIPKIFLEVFHDFAEYRKIMKEKYGRE